MFSIKRGKMETLEFEKPWKKWKSYNWRLKIGVNREKKEKLGIEN